jgi:hypothetical protein
MGRHALTDTGEIDELTWWMCPGRHRVEGDPEACRCGREVETYALPAGIVLAALL